MDLAYKTGYYINPIQSECAKQLLSQHVKIHHIRSVSYVLFSDSPAMENIQINYHAHQCPNKQDNKHFIFRSNNENSVSDKVCYII